MYGMKKKVISGKTIAIIIAIILILAVGWYLMSGSSSGSSADKKTASVDNVGSDSVDQALQDIDGAGNDLNLDQDFSFDVS